MMREYVKVLSNDFVRGTIPHYWSQQICRQLPAQALTIWAEIAEMFVLATEVLDGVAQ
jgi:hypothetical protein